MRYFQALLEARPDCSLRRLREAVGLALVSLDLTLRARLLRVLAGPERREKAAAVAEFSVDEGYLTTSSTGSELVPARAHCILP